MIRATSPPRKSVRNAHADQTELQADAETVVGGVMLGHLQDMLLELKWRLIWHPQTAAGLRGQPLTPALLKCLLHFVEVAPRNARSPAGLQDLLQLLLCVGVRRVDAMNAIL